MSIRCWWFGCEIHPQDPSENATCVRCGYIVMYSDLVGDTRHFRFMMALHRLTRKVWPHKCTDCFRRWRKCDDNVDHIPF